MLNGPARDRLRFSPNPFFIVRGRRLVVRRAVPGKSLAKNPFDYVLEEGRREKTFLPFNCFKQALLLLRSTLLWPKKGAGGL